MIKYHERIHFTSSTTPLNKDQYFPCTPNQLPCDQLSWLLLNWQFYLNNALLILSFPTLWQPGTLTNHCMLGNHLCLDECPSFEAEIIKNQAVVPSSQETPLPRPCRFNRQLDHLTHTESQEPWCHNGQWAVSCNLHTNNSQSCRFLLQNVCQTVVLAPICYCLSYCNDSWPTSQCVQLNLCSPADIQPSQLVPCHISAAPSSWLPIPVQIKFKTPF